MRHEDRINDMIHRWNSSGLPVEDRLFQALTEIERQHDLILTLQQRVHKQRVMLRSNWEIIEMRAQYARAWYPSKLLSSLLRRAAR